MDEHALYHIKAGGGTAEPVVPKTQRDSNLELYRILSMLLIVAHHYVVNSGLTAADGPIYANPLSWRSLFLLLLGAWGKTGINCFVMITGYFMCKSDITAKKFAKLVGEWLFYRYLLHAIFWITGYEPFTLKTAVLGIVPFTQIGSGFTSCFMLFFLAIPFLNVLVQHLSEKQHLYLLVLTGFIYIVFGTAHRVTMNYVSWFMVLYFIASYIRLYPKKLFEDTKLWGWLTLASLALSVISVVSATWLGTKLGRNLSYFFVADSNTFLAVTNGVLSFLFFKNLKMPYSKFINTVAASTFGVLCIHAHSDAMRQWLWRDTLNNVGMYASPYMPLHAICSVLGVFIICNAIDHLRIRFLEKPFFLWWDKHWPRLSEHFQRKESILLKKIGAKE